MRRQQAQGGSFGGKGTGVDPLLRSSWSLARTEAHLTFCLFTPKSFFSTRLLSSALTNEITPYLR